MRPGHCVALIALLALPSRLHAQATPFEPPDARVYDDIDRLAGAGLINTMIVGTRPWSRREIVRLLTEARTSLAASRNPSAWAERVVRTDLALYVQRVRWADEIVADAAALRSASRPIERDPNGGVNASINPLGANRSGLPLPPGSAATIESMHSVTLGQYIAFAFNPRLSVIRPDARSTALDVRLQTGSATALFGNLSLEAGRDYAIFGQAATGGLLLSENAPPLDMIRVSNDQPARMPSFLNFLGPARGTLIVADLGAAQQHPHTTLIGYHVSILPSPQLELGLDLIDLMGGSDRPGTSLTAKLVDLLPFIDPILRRRSVFPDSLSNKMAGGDIRWRVPAFTGLQLYSEFALDDFDGRRLRSSFLEDGGYVFGAFASCLAECGTVGVRAEYRQTGIRYYTHNDYGVAEDGTLLGDPLGPRGLGAYLTIDDVVRGAGRFSLSGAFEVRSGNTYASQATGPDTRGFHFIQVLHRPGEHRQRLTGSWEPQSADARIALRATMGIERTSDYAFVEGTRRFAGLGEVRLELRP